MNSAPGRKPFWTPRTNIFISQSGQLVVEVDLGGMQSGDLELTADGARIKIKGHRRNSEVAAAKTVLVNEIPAGPFESVLEIPSGFDVAHASSAYLNGVLRIVFPKRESPRAPKLYRGD
jgi:HSP20 family molecular chaperone IbpA